MSFNLYYAWLAARLKLPLLPPPMSSFAGVTFTVKPEHYQLRGVFNKRAIEPVLAQLLSLCDADTLFLDIGANVGLFSLLVASKTGAKAVAFEPVRSTFDALVRNCSHNQSLNISALNLALGSCATTIEITSLPGSGINQVVSVTERMGDPRQWTPQVSLDQLDVGQWLNELQRLVIKIDVERYEFEVLAGAQRLLALDCPIVLCLEVPPSERVRLESVLGSLYQAFDPPRVTDLSVTDICDPSNVFYANDLWPPIA